MGAERTFYETVRTAVGAVVNGSSVVQFPRVWIMPFLDLDKLMQNPRWPTAVIIDKGWTLNQSNGKIKSGAFDVVIVDAHPRDHVGDKTVLEIMDKGDLLVTALEYDTDNAVHSAGAGATDSITLDGGLIVVARTFTFTYELRRS